MCLNLPKFTRPLYFFFVIRLCGTSTFCTVLATSESQANQRNQAEVLPATATIKNWEITSSEQTKKTNVSSLMCVLCDRAFGPQLVSPRLAVCKYPPPLVPRVHVYTPSGNLGLSYQVSVCCMICQVPSSCHWIRCYKAVNREVKQNPRVEVPLKMMMSPSVSRYLGILGKVCEKIFRSVSWPLNRNRICMDTSMRQCSQTLSYSFTIHVIFLLVFFYDLAGAMSRWFYRLNKCRWFSWKKKNSIKRSCALWCSQLDRGVLFLVMLLTTKLVLC